MNTDEKAQAEIDSLCRRRLRRTEYLDEEECSILRSTTKPSNSVVPLLCNGTIVCFALEQCVHAVRTCDSEAGARAQTTFVESWYMREELAAFNDIASGTPHHFSAGNKRHSSCFVNLERCIDRQRWLDQRQFARILIPLCADGHWSLLVFERDANRWLHMDSLSATHWRLACRVDAMLRAARVLDGRTTLGSAECTPQGNGWACGYHVVANAAMVCNVRLDDTPDLHRHVGSIFGIAKVASAILGQSRANERASALLDARLRNYIELVH